MISKEKLKNPEIGKDGQNPEQFPKQLRGLSDFVLFLSNFLDLILDQ